MDCTRNSQSLVHVLGDRNLTRSSWLAPSAIAAIVLCASCVDLGHRWAGRQDAASDAASSGGIFAAGTDAGSGGSGGSATSFGAGGTAAGGTSQAATGGTAGITPVDAGSVADAAATGETRGTGGTGGIVVADAAGETGGAETGDTGGVVASDAGDVVDAASPQDIGVDVPFSADTNLPSDLGLVASDTAETGQLDASSMDGSDGPGTGDVGTDSVPAPMIISIDFVGGRPNGTAGASGTVVMSANESAGVKPARNWNSAPGSTGTLASLMSASGSLTTASASWNVAAVDGVTDTWSVSFTDAAGDTRMMNGYLDPRAADYHATISVTGLPDPMSSGYDVYVYCYSYIGYVDTFSYQYEIGATTYSVTQTGPSASTFPGYTLASGSDAGTAGAGNYVVFHNLSGPGFTLTALPRPSTNGTERAPVNGIQIVYPSGS